MIFSLVHVSICESESAVTQSCPALCDTINCSLRDFSVHGIFQARVLEWVAISFSRGSSWLRDQTRVSCIVGRCFYHPSHQGNIILDSKGEQFWCLRGEGLQEGDSGRFHVSGWCPHAAKVSPEEQGKITAWSDSGGWRDWVPRGKGASLELPCVCI